MKNLISFFWPITKKIKTQHNGVLELTIIDGQKILNSKNANYSYDSLQRILEFGIKKIDLSEMDNILLLGLGGGCIIHSLRKKFHYKKNIYAVEIDEDVINLAKNEFGIDNDATTIIEKNDAFVFVKNCKKKFNLIIVDVFIDNVVPRQFYTQEFCSILSTILTINGTLLFNLGINERNTNEADAVIDFFHQNKQFDTSVFKNVMSTNTLLLANKNNS